MDATAPPTENYARHAAELLELGDAFLELDRDWRIVAVNRNQEKLSRKTRSETLGRVLWEVWPEPAESETLYWHEYHRCMCERVPVQFENYYAPLDLWTSVTAYPVSTGGIAVFFRDITAMKRANRDQAHLASIIENTEEAIISKDLEGVILTWNQGAERLFGYRADEVIGRPITFLFTADRRDEKGRILAELRAGHHIDRFEATHVRKDGTFINVSSSVSPLRDASGKFVGASRIPRDITEQKHAEEAVRAALVQAEERRALLDAMMEHIPLGITIADAPDVTIRAVSRFGRELLEKTSEELTGIPAEQHPDAWAVFRVDGTTRASADALPLTRATVRGEFVHGEEWVVARRDGVKIPILCTAAPITDPQGNITGGVIGWQPLTERRQAERALRESEERFRTLADNIAQLAWIGDEQGGITWYNRRWFDYTGTTMEEMAGWGWQKVHHPGHLRGVVEKFRRHVERGEAWEDTFPLRGKDGTYRWFLSRAIPIRDEAGRVERWFGTNTEVTEQRDAQEELQRVTERLREADRRKDEFWACPDLVDAKFMPPAPPGARRTPPRSDFCSRSVNAASSRCSSPR
jgi:PAS domain S-box-containing protein